MNEDKKPTAISNPAQLKWACRRGMLELDVLLNHFLDEAYSGLSKNDQGAFVELLEHSDPDLFAWLLGNEAPSEQHLVHIIEMIRRHARSRV